VIVEWGACAMGQAQWPVQVCRHKLFVTDYLLFKNISESVVL